MRAFSVLPAQTVGVLICDSVLGAGTFYAALRLLAPERTPSFGNDWDGWLRILLAVLTVLFGLYFNELYSGTRVSSRVALLLQLCHVFGLSLVLQTLLAYINADMSLPRRVVLLATILGLPAFFCWRLVYSAFLWKLFGQQSVILVGNGSLAQELARKIAEKPERGIRLAGYVGDPVPEQILPAMYLGPAEELVEIVAQCKPDRVVVACSDRRDGGMPVEQLITLRRRAVPIEEGARLYEFLCTRVCSAEFLPAYFIFDRTLVHRPGSLALQSIYINILALCGIVLLFPLLFVMAVLVKFSTHGPVLDPVTCIGFRGIPFTLKRFRTRKLDRATGKAVITPLGRFLRRTHLDLLPALVNLLRGEMALVGPRPNRVEIAEELSERIPFYDHRYALRPGLTGWSQINMDSEQKPADALISLEYDLYYLKNMSLALDAYILLHRLRRMLTLA